MSRFATYRCTFCGALSDDVETLFAGPNHQAICDKCVSFGVARLNGEPAHDDIPGRLAKWRRAAPPTTTLHPLAEASSDGLERADKLLCVCYGSSSDPLDLGSLRGICLAEKVRPAQFHDNRILDALNVDPSLSVVWRGHGSLQENADHVAQRHLLPEFFVEPLSKFTRGIVDHVGDSVRVLRAGLKGRDRVASGRAHHSNADGDTGNGARRMSECAR